tara:strand:- start:158 stop:439 length:282 start_codon:yes stop_codon:yes gene_type:complete
VEHRSPINTDTLKVGDIISKWAKYSNRATLGEGTDDFEFRRHLIIEVVPHSHVETIVLFWKYNPNTGYSENPGSSKVIPMSAISGALTWRISE